MVSDPESTSGWGLQTAAYWRELFFLAAAPYRAERRTTDPLRSVDVSREIYATASRNSSSVREPAIAGDKMVRFAFMVQAYRRIRASGSP